MKRSLVVCLVFWGVTTWVSLCSAETSFDEKLGYLRGQRVSEVGRGAVVRAYEDFIEEYRDDPRVAKAMLELASHLERKFPNEETRDRAAAHRWYREAADAAVVGSGTWAKAKRVLAGRISSSAPAEAEALIQEVAEAVQGDSLLAAKSEHQLLRLRISQGDFEAAERHFHRLQHWYDDPARIPENDRVRADVDREMRNSSNTMVIAWKGMKWGFSKAERTARIKALMAEYHFNRALQRYGTSALQELAARRERILGQSALSH